MQDPVISINGVFDGHTHESVLSSNIYVSGQQMNPLLDEPLLNSSACVNPLELSNCINVTRIMAVCNCINKFC